MTLIDDLEPSAVSSLIETRPSIGLDELNFAAALQTRVDRKYVLPLDTALQALASVADELVVLQINGARSFQYQSLYFDTPDFASFRGAATGRRRRFKVRVRSYVESGQRALEVKTRSGRGETVKSRIDYQPARVDVLTAEACRFVDDTVQANDLAAQLLPTMWTAYHRTTLLDINHRSRTTIDRSLHARPLAGPWRTLTDRVIIETKSAAGATPLDRALWRLHVRPVAISKFAVAMAIHHRSLPANRWHRVIRDHFTTPGASSGDDIQFSNEVG
jgi:hypothetical protein